MVRPLPTVTIEQHSRPRPAPPTTGASTQMMVRMAAGRGTGTQFAARIATAVHGTAGNYGRFPETETPAASGSAGFRVGRNWSSFEHVSRPGTGDYSHTYSANTCRGYRGMRNGKWRSGDQSVVTAFSTYVRAGVPDAGPDRREERLMPEQARPAGWRPRCAGPSPILNERRGGSSHALRPRQSPRPDVTDTVAG